MVTQVLSHPGTENVIFVEYFKVTAKVLHPRKVQMIRLPIVQNARAPMFAGVVMEAPMIAHMQAAKDEIAKKAGTAAKSPRPCCA
mmetsp:Transcript_132586/g.258262  ORF Transcript_132586/g.258262 Transcript_132586/m.258262 type:complete len:85 (+) Transcript_132586:1239-1493(+)